MTNCPKCGEHMLSNSVCGRVGCGTTTQQYLSRLERTGHIPTPEHGKNGKREVGQLYDTFQTLRVFIAPSSKVFYFWACPPSSWKYLTRGQQDVLDIQRHIYHAPHGCHDWTGALSNAADRHSRTTVRYVKVEALRESLLAADYAFRDAMVMESSREVATRDRDYARHLEYCASNLELYLRDKRNREAACGIA